MHEIFQKTNIKELGRRMNGEMLNNLCFANDVTILSTLIDFPGSLEPFNEWTEFVKKRPEQVQRRYK